MNMQAMLKQAQKLQKDMMSAKEEIDNKVFIGKSSMVTVEIMGNKLVKKVKIEAENLEKTLKAWIQKRSTLEELPPDEHALFLSLQNKRISTRTVQELVKKYPDLIKELSK